MKEFKFNKNYNNKLNNPNFTTIRLNSSFEIQEKVKITLNTIHIGYYYIIGKKKIKLNQINEYIARLDTGLCAEEAKKLIKQIYNEKEIDWETETLYFYLLAK